MKLKIKTELLGAQIHRNGVTFDTKNTLQEAYINFYTNGFADCFDIMAVRYTNVVAQPACQDRPICACGKSICDCKKDEVKNGE